MCAPKMCMLESQKITILRHFVVKLFCFWNDHFMYNKNTRTKWVPGLLPRFVTQMIPLPTLQRTALHPASLLSSY